MKRLLGGLAAVLLVLILVMPALASPGNSGQCPDYQNNIPTTDGTIVLPAGTSFCVHASNANTGIQTADGIHDLNYYIALYITNGGGQVPAISNYVIYGGQPSPSPSSTSSPSTSPSATPSPTTVPSSSPSEEPSPTPTASPSPSSSPLPTSSPTSSPSPSVVPSGLPTPPSTDTEMTSQTDSHSTGTLLVLAGLAAVTFAAGFVATGRKVR